jgi:hypothetical protein
VVVAVKGRGVRTVFTISFLVFFSVVSGLWSQAVETEELEIPPRKMMLFYRAEPSPLSEPENLVIYDSLVIALHAVREDCSVIEAAPLAGPETFDERSSVARRLICDSWMYVNVSSSGDKVTVKYILFDSVNEVVVKEDTFTGDKPDARELSRLFWLDTANSLKLLKPLDPLPSYVIKGVPGTVVSGFPKGPIRLGISGKARVTVSVPATYTLRAEKYGYEPLKMQVLLKEKGGEVQLEQRKGSLFSFDAGLYNSQIPSFSFGVFLVPDEMYFKIDLTNFNWGIGPFMDISSRDRGFDPFLNLPLMHLGLQVGAYSSQADATFRWYYGMGGIVRLYSGGPNLTVEPVVPYGFYPLLGIEYSPNPKGRIFFEFTPMFYYVDKVGPYTGETINALMDNIFPAGYTSTTVSYKPWIVDYMSFRLGYRRHL